MPCLSNWTFVPLRGKIPIQNGWQTGRGLTYEQARAASPDGNVGLRTGAASGVVVIDIDLSRGAKLPDLPETLTVETGGGGLHMYYALPPGNKVGNSVGRLGPHIDVRGDGGQVVFPGSVHPETKRPYVWRDESVPIRTVPPQLLAKLTAPRLAKYARTAVDKEIAILMAAQEGARNDSLNRSAFNLGQIAATGLIPEAAVIDELRDAAFRLGLSEPEVSRTIESGWKAGLASPRRLPAPQATPAPAFADPTKTVLTPGEHHEPTGEVIEQGNDDFAAQVLRALPPGTLYRWERIVGELVGPQGRKSFRKLSPDRLRLLMDRACRLVRWKSKRNGEAEMIMVPASADHAGLVLAAAETSKTVRELRILTHYPVFAGADFDLSTPGWNPNTGVYYDEPQDLAGMGPAPPDAGLLLDLIVDFPFRDIASQANLVGLMLTPLIRPAVGTVPIHLVQSSIERTGKGMLISSILGNAIIGAHIPSVQLGEREEEREKRITTLILEGSTVIHLDNIPASSVLDSPSLCALVTSPVWKGRTLGESSMPALPNTLTLVASANNLRATSEVAKRIVPIWLEPANDQPEQREDYQHPDIHAYAAMRRREVLACLLGLVDAWKRRGKPPGRPRLGGFEAWAATVGGIMEGLPFGSAWMTNRNEWADDADEWGQQIRAFVDEWASRIGPGPATAAELLSIASDLRLFPEVMARPSDAARVQSFGIRVLKPLRNRPVGAWKIRVGSRRGYFLEPIESE